MIGKTNLGKMLGLVDLYRFSTERRLYVLREMLRQLGSDPAFAMLRALILEAIALDEETLELEAALKRRGSPRRHEEGAVDLDQALNRALGGLAARLRSELAVFGEGHPMARSALVLLGRLFPLGVAGITRLPFVEKSTQVKRILGEMKGPAAEGVRRFGLERLRGRLEELFGSYVRLLGPRGRPEVTAEVIAERERRGDAELRYIVVCILSAFGRPGVHDDGLCEELLGPILAQNEDLGVLLKARRAGKKVKGQLRAPRETVVEDQSFEALEEQVLEEPEASFLAVEEPDDIEEPGARVNRGLPRAGAARIEDSGALPKMRRSGTSRRLRPAPDASGSGLRMPSPPIRSPTLGPHSRPAPPSDWQRVDESHQRMSEA